MQGALTVRAHRPSSLPWCRDGEGSLTTVCEEGASLALAQGGLLKRAWAVRTAEGPPEVIRGKIPTVLRQCGLWCCSAVPLQVKREHPNENAPILLSQTTQP